jgi:hypothetical protein
MWRIILIYLSIYCCALVPIRAQSCPGSQVAGKDYILFLNNDTLTGDLLSIDSDSILFASQTLGELNIPWRVIKSIESKSGSAILPGGAESRGRIIEFRRAFIEKSNETVTLKADDQKPRLILGALKFRVHCIENSEMATASPKTAAPQKAPVWVLNLKTPAFLAFGTASQETFGGTASLDVFSGTAGTSYLYHSRLVASGTHNRTWQVGSPFVTTDTFNAFFQQSRSFGTTRGGIYGKAETFLNTSLGLAAQDSFGLGYYSPVKNYGPVQFNWLADTRYFRERLYATPGSLDLVGSRLEGQLIYRKTDPSDKSKTKYSVILKTWLNPMWNDERALQAFATLSLSVPIRRSLCISFNPIEDDYLRNAPLGNRKNYATSSVSLSIEHGSDPKQRCY